MSRGIEEALAIIGLACAAVVLLIDAGVELELALARRAWGTLAYHAARRIGTAVLILLAVDVLLG
jgi:hypothetical protein